MSTLEYIRTLIFPAAFSLLPERMDSPEARAMMIAIGLQESRFTHRRQINGPARGFWQFEKDGGVRGVMNHPSSKLAIGSVLLTLDYDFLQDISYEAIAHNDVLALCYARLLLWTLPQSLPKRGDTHEGWNQYISAWRPGRPHPGTWDAFFNEAWDLTTKGDSP